MTAESKSLLKTSVIFVLFASLSVFGIHGVLEDGTGTWTQDSLYPGQPTEHDTMSLFFPIIATAALFPALFSAVYEWRYARRLLRQREKAHLETF